VGGVATPSPVEAAGAGVDGAGVGAAGVEAAGGDPAEGCGGVLAGCDGQLDGAGCAGWLVVPVPDVDGLDGIGYGSSFGAKYLSKNPCELDGAAVAGGCDEEPAGAAGYGRSDGSKKFRLAMSAPSVGYPSFFISSARRASSPPSTSTIERVPA
jgi:hypothetical protein